MNASVGIARHPAGHVVIRMENGASIDILPGSGVAIGYLPGGRVCSPATAVAHPAPALALHATT